MLKYFLATPFHFHIFPSFQSRFPLIYSTFFLTGNMKHCHKSALEELGMKKGCHKWVPRVPKSPAFTCKRRGLRFWQSCTCPFFESTINCAVHTLFIPSHPPCKLFQKSSNLVDIRNTFILLTKR